MKWTVKGRSSTIVGIIALAIVGFSFASSCLRRIGVVDPRVTIERRKSVEAGQAATLMRLQMVHQVMTGEVSTTAERLRDAAAMATAASLLAVVERPTSTPLLLKRLAERDLLPSGVSPGESGRFVSPYGSMLLHFRPAPLGVEVISIGKDKGSGPALIVRVGDIPGAEGIRVWASTRLDEINLPRPFADESEVIAAGWQAETLAADR
jgi:hypothetical protein